MAPACFATLSEEAQQNFFARCKQEKQDAKKTMFSYKTVRDTLVTQICEETRKVRIVGVSGTYLPLSVYRARGYEVDQGFTTRNPSEWSPGLNQWTYLLVESSVSEAGDTGNHREASGRGWESQYASAKLPRWLQMRKRRRTPQPQGLQQLSWTWSQSQMKAICLQDQSKLWFNFNLALTCYNFSAHCGSLSRNIYNESVFV